MKNFWGSFLGAITGSVVAAIIASIIIIVGIAAIVTTAVTATTDSSKGESISENSVIQLSLDYEVLDRSFSNPFSGLSFSSDGRTPGLDQIREGLRHAATNSKIKGIYLDLHGLPSGMAVVEEIRAYLSEFKKSGKFIVAYSEDMSQKAYYLATVADEIYLNPMGEINFRGLGMEMMFFKNTLAKLGVEAEIIRPANNKFKSAVEPFVLEKASDANREQLESLLHSIWNRMLMAISEKTQLGVEELNVLANTYAVYDADEALKYNFITGLKYEDEFLDILREKTGIAKEEKLPIVKFSRYARKYGSPNKKSTDDKIAIIYASGEINMGHGTNEEIGASGFTKAIREARENKDVKAIVLRVNSPGGSALASDMIWREVWLAKQKKPVVVSMGNYAASGGYYISCAADTIVAEPTTLTGSIGVFGVMFNSRTLLREKLGISTDTVKTNRMADFPTGTRSMRPEEKQVLQRSVDKIYKVFLERVAEGRSLSVEQVDSIAQGRVWTGEEAFNVGLVDVLGGFEDAVKIAAQMAKLEKYNIMVLPKEEDPIEKFFEDFSASTSQKVFGENIYEIYNYYRHLQSLVNMEGVQARMDFDGVID